MGIHATKNIKFISSISPSVITMHIPTPEELRARREALGMKQTELAKRAGISQSMVARIEAGNVDPRVSTLIENHYRPE